MNKQETYRSTISDFLGVDQKKIHTYWKGRIALYTALKAMNIGKGDEVILPAFTCVVVHTIFTQSKSSTFTSCSTVNSGNCIVTSK